MPSAVIINTPDNVNHLVDVRDIIIYIGKNTWHVGLECITIKIYLTNPTPILAFALPGFTNGTYEERVGAETMNS
jgi:hypothetical protein